MTEIRNNVSRYPGITEKFKEAKRLSGALTYVQACVTAIDVYLGKL
jgi:hypothetical protein